MTELLLNQSVIGTFSVSYDRERFVGEYKTREEAIANAWNELDIQRGATFYTAQNLAPVVTIDTDRFIEDVAQTASDDCGDVADGWLADVSKEEERELGKRLAVVFEDWLKATDNVPKFFRCENIEEHRLP